jgi:DNA invertase Pin-like site-specific DNA recombinase
MKMSLLQELGLTKESMAKMLGPVPAFKAPDPMVYRRWEAVPAEIRESILKEHPTRTYRELAKKYGISHSCVWNIKNKQPNKQ